MRKRFEARHSTIHGQGLFAVARIRRGARLLEYTGERVSDDEATRRYDDAEMDHHHTFLFDLGDGTALDGAVGGNDARFINHACAPNCEACIEDGRVFIYALRDIAPGSELLLDYAYVGVDASDPEVRAFYACRCGARRCRGTLVAPSKRRARPAA